ncbi:MAG: type I DNA topoisomerase [Propionibacteriaceae bacterium]|jgi:DNA topoisomerase-1|nr:type I DNA topoisomerase [Propionibacteriaceae bacterium]
MGHTSLVIVESPTKAAKISSYLGSAYIVESSRGHVRDLPTTAAEIPAKYKKEKWARTGVDVDNEFHPLYVVSSDKKKTISELKKILAGVDELLLATDEDREGEAIAWHLIEELKPKVPVKRMVFHEITEQAIKAAVASPREVDTDLVDAQETRRILDRLYGYEVSPVLWRKVMPRLSAGRVQSVATRLIVDREKERMAFRSASYWDITAMIDAGATVDPRRFSARLTQVGDTRIAQGRDFNSRGEMRDNLVALSETLATMLAATLEKATYSVVDVESRPYTRKPYAPFRTTTLQQEAGRKLGFTAQRTMAIAQDLYEAGWITYMRTDSVTLSSQAIQATRTQVKQLFGEKYLPEKPRVYTSKVKNAQEAHEAIRPAGDSFRTPKDSGLVGDQRRLYELIWMRTLASQMADALGESVSVKINAAHPELTIGEKTITDCRFVASGRTVTFPGFLKAYVESHDDPDESEDDAQARLPHLEKNHPLSVVDLNPEAHATKPPARYTEPSLVAKLEELEIGRPSTYASIIRTITSRDYVFKRGAQLVPTWLAFAVTRLLEEQFSQLVDYTFTATMEDDLDEIANGGAKRLDILNRFYFGTDSSRGLNSLVTELGDIDPRKLSTFGIAGDEGLVVRVGRYGPYIEDSLGKKVTIAADLPPDELTEEKALALIQAPVAEERELGISETTGYRVVTKDGRFGPYVTEVLPEDAPKSAKARTGSLFSSMSIETVTLEQAESLMSLPRTLGEINGVAVTAQNGRYGPYIKMDKTSRPLPTQEAIFEITLDEAKVLLDAPPVRGGGRSTGPLKELGNDPETGKPVTVKDGRFGPYVTDGTTNATLRRSDSVEEITPERAFELLAEKRAKPPTPKKTTRRTTKSKK